MGRRLGAVAHARLLVVEEQRREVGSGFEPAPDIDHERPTRRVEPHHVVTRAGPWYLIGWDLDRDDWRVFRVDRITARTPNGPRFDPRELTGSVTVGAFVAAMFQGRATPRLAMPRGVLLNLPDTAVAPFDHHGIVEESGTQCCRLVVGLWAWAGLVAMIGRYDTDIEVVGPPELLEEFARIAARYTRAAVSAPTR